MARVTRIANLPEGLSESTSEVELEAGKFGEFFRLRSDKAGGAGTSTKQLFDLNRAQCAELAKRLIDFIAAH